MATVEFTRRTAQLPRTSTLAVGCLLVAAGCGYSEKEVTERVNGKTAELRTTLDQDIAKLFLNALVEEDYGGAQILLAKSAPLASRAKGAPGREKALREFVRGWLAEHGLGGSRFAAFDIHGLGKAPEKHLDYAIAGYFEVTDPGKAKVHFRVKTTSHRVWGFELSQRALPYF